MRASIMVVLGVLAGSLPQFASDRTAFELISALTAPWRTMPAGRGMLVVALDAKADAHASLAALPRSDWPEIIAMLVEDMLDAGVDTVAFDLVWPLVREDSPRWLAMLRRGGRDGSVILGYLHDGERMIAPHPAQVAALGGSGRLASLNVDAEDGRVRRAPDRPDALAAALSGDPGGRAPLLQPWRSRAVRVISLGDLLDCDDSHVFDGTRIALFGAWQPHVDRHAAVLRLQPATVRQVERIDCDGGIRPETVSEPVPGVLLHALSVLELAAGDAPERLPRHMELALLAMHAVLAALWRGGWANASLALAALAGASAGLLHGWLYPWAGAFAAMGTVRIAHRAIDLHRSWIAWIAALPAAFRTDPARAGLVDATVCFIDIVQWTTRGEGADACKLADELSAVLATLGGIITAYGGHVDKYLGDGLMAVFGLDGRDGHPARAVAAVRACLGTRMRIANRPVRLRAGLARGPVRAGDLAGQDGRIHFTVIGDAVNVAARLEQHNRALGTCLLADKRVVDACPGTGWKPCGDLVLRGRSEPVEAWTL